MKNVMLFEEFVSFKDENELNEGFMLPFLAFWIISLSATFLSFYKNKKADEEYIEKELLKETDPEKREKLRKQLEKANKQTIRYKRLIEQQIKKAQRLKDKNVDPEKIKKKVNIKKLKSLYNHYLYFKTNDYLDELYSFDSKYTKKQLRETENFVKKEILSKIDAKQIKGSCFLNIEHCISVQKYKNSKYKFNNYIIDFTNYLKEKELMDNETARKILNKYRITIGQKFDEMISNDVNEYHKNLKKELNDELEKIKKELNL